MNEDLIDYNDPEFLKEHVKTLKENLLNCHNELQMIYGQLNVSKDYIKHLEAQNLKLKIELTIHGIELKDEEDI